MTETTKTPNPLKQARRNKRDAKAIKRFVKEYLDARWGLLTDGEKATIREMLRFATVRSQEASSVLAALKVSDPDWPHPVNG